MDKARIIWVADPMGDEYENAREMEKYLKKNYNIIIDIEVVDMVEYDSKFDVMFFDWGGLSVGNSMLDYFSKELVESATNHPGRIYVITSTFTGFAVKEAVDDFGGQKPDNIFYSVDDAIGHLRAFC